MQGIYETLVEEKLRLEGSVEYLHNNYLNSLSGATETKQVLYEGEPMDVLYVSLDLMSDEQKNKYNIALTRLNEATGRLQIFNDIIRENVPESISNREADYPRYDEVTSFECNGLYYDEQNMPTISVMRVGELEYACPMKMTKEEYSTLYKQNLQLYLEEKVGQQTLTVENIQEACTKLFTEKNKENSNESKQK